MSLFACLSFSVILFAQNNAATDIEWYPNIQLQWSDFKGEPSEKSSAAAITSSSIGYSISAEVHGDRVITDIQVNCAFDSWRSWYKPKLANDNLLQHERLHFDIAALFAKKLEERLKNTTYTKNVKKEARTIYIGVMKELKAYQSLYDRETDFSRNKEQQVFWNKKIAKAIENERIPE